MSFKRFLLSQILLYVSLSLASFFASGTDFLSNLIMNFITFFTTGFLIVFLVDKSSPIYMNVLSSALCFNAVTYLLHYYVNQPLPHVKKIILDFIIVTVFTLLGAKLGVSKRFSN